ncbi:pyrroline-5-carboxylate reductase [Mangrovibacillus cuniculi]|uniref:Pyrroline-5-carboxylate reductase n=1 Tax=Mangrovibacillus cuniculi TaxID=2593652 RepID=A0A7S8HEG9_9BACI|nr:pyrroline-5-carboxylate reductase [Mangrovibacillus cuniculi]QPC45829.1 pyrroline-5-carboxylate reductase [Mangrovibacillus cuniculi]
MSIIGFIGCGNMAQAIIGGILASDYVPADHIIASARSPKTLENAATQFGIRTTLHNKDVAKEADVLFLAVKPNQYAKVMTMISDYLKEDVLIVSMAAGVTINQMEDTLGDDRKIVRTMPNTPSFVRQGMTAYTVNGKVSKDEKYLINELLEQFGKAEEISEQLMDAIPAVSGSSPAYGFVMIEAMGDAAVKQGIPRDQAYRMAAQSMLGAAAMVLETGDHPALLKDRVCSPGGATIEAVMELERSGFRHSIQSAMEACTNKSIAMGKK